ncbi:MAG: RecX family transcriptional regulator, partial [Sediminibacterium sp.]|nr:RecX family transcriptional regulator [Sediminibacterium sp.]
SGEDAARIIGLLQQEGYINEERYAQLFVGGYFRQKNWGRNKIIAALRMKGIQDAAIRKGLQEIDAEQYRQVLQKMTAKLWKQYAREPIEKRKLATRAALIRKGFESDLIRKALQKVAE